MIGTNSGMIPSTGFRSIPVVGRRGGLNFLECEQNQSTSGGRAPSGACRAVPPQNVIKRADSVMMSWYNKGLPGDFPTMESDKRTGARAPRAETPRHLYWVRGNSP